MGGIAGIFSIDGTPARREELRSVYFDTPKLLLREEGVAFPNDFRPDSTADHLREQYGDEKQWPQDKLNDEAIKVSVAGRIMAKLGLVAQQLAGGDGEISSPAVVAVERVEDQHELRARVFIDARDVLVRVLVEHAELHVLHQPPESGGIGTDHRACAIGTDGIVNCPRCQHENPAAAKFCEQCATPLGRVCPSCGLQVSATAKFCPECGTPLKVTGKPMPAKRRKSATEIESMTVIGEIKGKTILMVDDLTETAGTLTTAAKLLKEKGAKQILACVSHAILNDLGIQRLRKSVIDELITTDTVLRPAIDGVKITTLSVAGLLGEAIKRIHCNSSVTSLFEFKGGRTS